VFTVPERLNLQDRLVADARTDARIAAAALVGSAALDAEDEWSDIDLAPRLAEGLEPDAVVDAWTERMYAEHQAMHHLDVWANGTLFRVFLLRSSLQVDLSFWPSPRFAANGPAFRLLFGQANEPVPVTKASTNSMIGMGWLYALHGRSSIARARRWQAAYMIDGIREQVTALACRRHGLPSYEGRGVDDLPEAVLNLLAGTLVAGLDDVQLSSAFQAAVQALMREAELADPDLAGRLASSSRRRTHQDSKNLRTTHAAGDRLRSGRDRAPALTLTVLSRLAISIAEARFVATAAAA